MHPLPLDSTHHELRLLLLEELEHLIGVVAVDVRLLEELEADAVVDLAEAADVLVSAWLLSTELVAREAETVDSVRTAHSTAHSTQHSHHQSLVLVLLVQLLQASVLRREPTLACCLRSPVCS